MHVSETSVAEVQIFMSRHWTCAHTDCIWTGMSGRTSYSYILVIHAIYGLTGISCIQILVTQTHALVSQTNVFVWLRLVLWWIRLVLWWIRLMLWCDSDLCSKTWNQALRTWGCVTLLQQSWKLQNVSSRHCSQYQYITRKYLKNQILWHRRTTATQQVENLSLTKQDPRPMGDLGSFQPCGWPLLRQVKCVSWKTPGVHSVKADGRWSTRGQTHIEYYRR